MRDIAERIVFLGTGGGRMVTFTQVRATGGIYCELSGIRFVIDPGPGALAHLRRLKLKDPMGVLLSHAHVDHYTDVNVILDGISEKYGKGFLIAEKHCLNGENMCVQRYIQERTAYVFGVEPNDEVSIPNTSVSIRAIPTRHNFPCVGFRISAEKATLCYSSDGFYYEGMETYFEGCDVAIFNVMVPYNSAPKELKHMSTDDVINILNKLKEKPKLAVLHHFSFWMLRNNPHLQARIVEKQTGVKTIAARDFAEIDLSKYSKSVQQTLE